MLSLKADFYAVGDGVTDDTWAVKAWFSAMVHHGLPGWWDAGTYSVREGELAFDCGFADRAFPRIFTAGYHQTVIIGQGGKGALLSFANGMPDSPVGRYWRGGGIDGGLTFSSSGGDGLLLRGVEGAAFGPLRFKDCAGSGVRIPLSVMDGYNPDPAAVWNCSFHSIEANFCGGWALRNENFVGFTVNRIGMIRAIGCAGGWYGFGSGNAVSACSMGDIREWAFDDGGADGAPGGSPSRISLGRCELDNVRGGFRINRTTGLEADARFVHRYRAGVNKSEGYWPRVALDIGGGPVIGASRRVKIDMVHRLEAGGSSDDLGLFCDGHNTGNNVGIFLDHQVINAPGLTVTKDDLTNGFRHNARARITSDSRMLLDTLG